MLFERTENPKPTPIPTATPEPTATPIPSATPEPTATPEPEPTATPVPVPTDIPTPSPKPLPTVTPEPLPETPEEPEVLQDNVNTLLPGTVAALGTGTGFICLLFLYFRRKKVFHGVYDEAVNSKNKDYTDMDNWYVPTLAEKVKTGQLTAGEFIETVRNCKYKSKFPSDTKVSLILDGETITSNATEKDLFKALTENNQIPVSIAFSSKKTGLNLTITFRE